MEIRSLPINVGPNKDIEEIGLITHGSTAYDVFFDSNGNVARRPGLSQLCNLGVANGVDGLYWWDRQEKVIAITGGRIFEITASDGTNAEISGDTFETGTPVYWADFGTSLYGANGGKIVKIPSSGNAVYVADGDAPTTVSHVGIIDDILLALSDGTQQVHYATTSDPDDWPGSWISAIAKPDLLKALGVGRDIVELFGTEIIEGWRNDGSTPLVKDSQYTVNRGISAPHSLVFLEDVWYWLDETRKVVRLNGNVPEPLSLTMNKYIQGFSTVSDAIGGKTYFEGRPQYVLTFPTEDKTLAYDIYNGIWSELGYYSGGSYSRFLGQSFCLATKWNLNLVGDRTTGKVYKLDSSTYQDGGNTLRSMVRTPHVHWGYPGVWKRSYRLDFYLKKSSVVAIGDAAELIVKWRDNGETTWKGNKTISLGSVGKTDFHGSLFPMGRYRTRQYEFAMSDNSPLVLSRVDERFDIQP